MNDLTTNFCGVILTNPFVLPSGIITEIPEHKRAIEAGVGAVTLKSLTYHKREGNPIPRVWRYDCGMINSVGLRNAGIEKGSEEIAKFIEENKKIPVIVSLFATKIEEFIYLIDKIVPLEPAIIELNLSCPNVDDEFGKPLGMERGAAGQIVKEVKKRSFKIPVLAKLSPNVTNISEIAKSCEHAGADGIAAINTVGPGMIIDINKKKPVLGAIKGGVSGQGILPIAVRCVYEIYEAVKIPIIGMGGVSKWQDAVEMIMAGGTLIGVGTATYSKGMRIYEELKKDLIIYMQKQNIKNLKDIVGIAHH
ncbi:dihydroorotate dehydrogenase [Candidatus Gottesmanbacteria bacterium CG_4_10_14_0_8_um_filter_37_24]|uniref:Dihydroorotate dehydrogenase n=2 Tax=Candidatus Gottesmaniibacteriota TaxID=1752720 RepID=A0A2M7RSK1_9BACT|nr:MAG: dihydroorotate dehydrogenase B catalytic subunit [Candidatus Gottesmanbacteria bacterium CG1_02_37_22]PIZ03246.1 MAG: dihydroorotate dehydrogenase [Candidatus Gottesmanbacteria bacterium CG_4_10_14_0_8_um_filter_37_24]